MISVSSDELLDLTRSDEVTLLEVLPKIGIEIEKIEGDDWELEVNPDRCDLLSVEGIGRAVRGFLRDETGLPDYETSSSDIVTKVELSVQDVRPYIVTAAVKNVDLSDPVLKSMMDLQEKLHLTIGRNRSKVAIGVHDLEPIEPPITYKAVKPEEISFRPLEKSIEMDLQEILEKHDKGKKFAHILEDKERYPLILDSKEDVLSFPPVINGQMTQVTPETDSLFIDMTGTDMRALEQTLNILCTMFAERGAEIYTTEVKYGNRSITYPDFTPEEMDISPSECRKILGFEVKDGEIVEILQRMRYDADEKEDSIEVKIPAYRHDILHPWDIIEDIAIGFDYDNFEGVLPENVTIGESLDDSELRDTVTELLIGYGFKEVMNYILSCPEKEFEDMEMEKEQKIAKVENPVSEDSVSLRTWLLPGLLSNLKDNRTQSLPRKLFEIGDVISPNYQQKTKIAGVIQSSNVGFTKMKSILDGLLTNLGFEMTVEANKHGSFIDGRCAGVYVSGEKIGYFGEISPEVLENFELENPVVGFEMDFEVIYEVKYGDY
ncbi:MAG: phenylalanine--tRNA ligase subunit beta [Candidatus Thermoplasmatota archaeon]|nr:phenylalanine--tRNA ligase subunit beta [Candidatus Thermoplasmatota archaeon]